MFILNPHTEEKAYKKAVCVFLEYYEKITGISLTMEDEASQTEDMIVIGSEAVQPFAYQAISGGLPIRANSDEYCIISKEDSGRKILFLAGGCGRATLYAVYDFFERRANCHYFWDGDVIAMQDEIDIGDLYVHEIPRFTYRAIRYFAHRGLTRFQAEFWDFDDWKREIDWIVKSRLNVFMLRIGIDDLFQKAFPEVVSYPSNEDILPEATVGFNNRTTFWDLKYRGELRKKVLEYAFSCGLIHPEDCGTMTHWYSRTPKQFIDAVKPTFLAQKTKSYSEPTGLVWDITEDKNWKNYQKLTDTHIAEYGKAEMFHTIGLAERTYAEDRRKNLDLKKFAYRKIIDYAAQKNPNAPLLIAAWDFYFCLNTEEIREITSIFNPDQVIVFDYTVDLKAMGNDFESWGIVGKIPWIFGIFHAYEPQSHIHGDYAYIEQKLKVANEDPFCKGMAFWPELSHSDTLMLEYFRENAWNPKGRSVFEIAKDMCFKRYGKAAQEMLSIWNAFILTMQLPTKAYMASFFDILNTDKDFLKLLQTEREDHKICEQNWLCVENLDKKFDSNIQEVLTKIIAIPRKELKDTFVRRDVLDIVRTVVVKKAQYIFIHLSLLILRWIRGEENENEILKVFEYARKSVELFGDVLGLHTDYSLYDSILKLEENRKINQHFEKVLKDNTVNWYCRSGVFEAVKGVYVKEVSVFGNWLRQNLAARNRQKLDMTCFAIEKQRIFEEFLHTPLSDFQHNKKTDINAVIKNVLTLFGEIENEF